MKIPTEDFTDKTLAIDDTYEDDVKEIVVLVMEVVDEVTNMEVDKVTDMTIPIEDLTDLTLAIGDTYGDDVRGGYMCDGHGG